MQQMQKTKDFALWQKIVLIVLAIVVLAVGILVSPMLLMVVSVMAVCMFLAYFSPEKIIYVYLFLYALTPNFLGIDLGANLPLITVSRGILALYLVLEMIFNRKIFIENLGRLKNNSMNIVIVLFVVVHVIILVRYLNPESIKKFISLITENVAITYIVFLRIRNKKELQKCIDVLLISAAVIGLLGCIEFVTGQNPFIMLGGAGAGFEGMMSAGNDLIRSGFRRIYGPFIHPLALGCYIAIMLPVAIHQFFTTSKSKIDRRVLYAMLIGLLAMNMMFTLSRSTLLFVILGFFVYFVITNRETRISIMKFVLPMVAVAVVLGLFGLLPSFITEGIFTLISSLFSNTGTSDFGSNANAYSFRLRQIFVADKVAAQAPWLGNGMGYLRLEPIYDFYYEFFPYEKYRVTSFDNYYLIKLMETGIIGLSSFVVIFVHIGIDCVKNLYTRVNNSFSRLMIFIMIAYFLCIASVDESHTLKYMWLMAGLFMCSDYFEKEKPIPVKLEYETPLNCIYDMSFVIVSYKSCNEIKNNLDSMIEHFDGFTYEIIVVNNFAKDPYIKDLLAEYENTTLITNDDNGGFGQACNIGLKAAKGRYTCFINPDIINTCNPLPLLKFMDSNPKIGLSGPLLRNPDKTLQRSCYEFPSIKNWRAYQYYLNKIVPKIRRWGNYPRLDFAYDESSKVDWLSGAYMVMPTGLALKLEGFDEKFFMYSEDVDLCWKVQDAGYEVWFLYCCEAIHVGGTSTGAKSENSAVMMAQAHDILFKKRFGKKDAQKMLIISYRGARMRQRLLALACSLHISKRTEEVKYQKKYADEIKKYLDKKVVEENNE